MNKRTVLPYNHLTVDDFFIWAGLAMQFEHLRYPFTRPSLLPADRCDADLMLVLAEVKPCLPGTKAVAHRLVAGRLADSVRINGLWVALA